jgi:transketolase
VKTDSKRGPGSSDGETGDSRLAGVSPRWNLEELDQICRNVRVGVLELTSKRKTSHVASALSCVELLVTTYGTVLRANPAEPEDPDRDRFILSKGHASVAHYVTLQQAGYFDADFLDQFAINGSLLGEQPAPGLAPGIELATGSLGHGLSVGIGMSYAAKLSKKDYRTFVLMSDGEMGEGSVWEAGLLAPMLGLDNLIAIVDYNKLQATGRSDEILSLRPLADKWLSFGWNVEEIDGHDLEMTSQTLMGMPLNNGKPTMIVAHTVKGKGVSFMEDDLLWHYRPPNDDELSRALDEVRNN